MSREILQRHRATWHAKPILRLLYTEWYRDIATWLRPGRTLEVGGGSGNLKEFSPQVVCTDLVIAPWLDAVVDAESLPFAAESFSNIVLFDCFHHIENVRHFLDEAVRVLTPGGRLLIMDPYISWASWPIYRYLHPEPVDLAQDPLEIKPASGTRTPFDSNQALATILFERMAHRFQAAYPQLKQLVRRRLAFWVYPLSGGFEHPSMIPMWVARQLLKAERALEWMSCWLAFRIFVVIEKQHGSEGHIPIKQTRVTPGPPLNAVGEAGGNSRSAACVA